MLALMILTLQQVSAPGQAGPHTPDSLGGLALVLTIAGGLGSFLLWHMSEDRAKREYSHELRSAWMQIDEIVLTAAAASATDPFAAALFHTADNILHGAHANVFNSAKGLRLPEVAPLQSQQPAPTPAELIAMKRWFVFMVLNTFVSAHHAIKAGPPRDLSASAVKSILARLLTDTDARDIVLYGGYDESFIDFCRDEGQWLSNHLPSPATEASVVAA